MLKIASLTVNALKELLSQQKKLETLMVELWWIIIANVMMRMSF